MQAYKVSDVISFYLLWFLDVTDAVHLLALSMHNTGLIIDTLRRAHFTLQTWLFSNY